MPRASGVYTAPPSSWSPAVNAASATLADWNALLADMVAALTQSLSVDGQTTVTGNIPMGTKKLTGLGAGTGVGDSLRFEQLFSQGNPATVASAATVDIGAQNTVAVEISGVTTITSLGTNYNGPRYLRFTGALTLTHNAITLNIPGAASVTTAAGDMCIVYPNVTLNGWNVVFYQVASQAAGSFPLSFRNRIINGAMLLDQRNSGVEQNPAVSGTYYLDRWLAASSQVSKFKIGQNAGAITPPIGFANYLGITSLSAYAVPIGENYSVQQRIEGLNVIDLAWGTASAKPVALSFWVRSSLTGTFGGAIRNSASDRSYPFSYTVIAANTWEQKSVLIAGDTIGTWLVTNGIGVILNFGLGVGATFSNTAGAWAAGNYLSSTGAVSVVGTNLATWYVTGVQFEPVATITSPATAFEQRPYGLELMLAQRYLPASNNAPCSGMAYAATAALFSVPFDVPAMRAPTGMTVLAQGNCLDSGLVTRALSATIFNNAGIGGAAVQATTSGGLVAGNATLTTGANYLFTGCEL